MSSIHDAHDGIFSTGDLVSLAGADAKLIDRLCAAGALEPVPMLAAGKGRHRRFAVAEALIAAVLVDLAAYGLTVTTLAKIAPQLREAWRGDGGWVEAEGALLDLQAAAVAGRDAWLLIARVADDDAGSFRIGAARGSKPLRDARLDGGSIALSDARTVLACNLRHTWRPLLDALRAAGAEAR